VIKVITFENALDMASSNKKLHILLGNGFSRACRNNIFAYDALFNRANFNNLSPYIRNAFTALSTIDFEIVMRGLRQAATIILLYQEDNHQLANQLRIDADSLKEVLVSAIADSHPEMPSDIDNQSYAACKKFLNHFQRIFTLNYDLLLYWTLMQTEIKPNIPCDDGFRKPDDGEAGYVTWEPENTYNQNIYYLHGALHIFDAGTKIQKYTWVNTGIRLIEQIRSALQSNIYPLFVAEGESRQKLERIRHSDFLSKAQRSLLNISGSMFIYGHSLADNDSHIFRLLLKSKIQQIFISIYGDPHDPSNKQVITRANSLAHQGLSKKPLTIEFYDASSAHVWG